MKKIFLVPFFILFCFNLYSITFTNDEGKSLLSIDCSNNVKTYAYNNTIIKEIYSPDNLLQKRQEIKGDQERSYNYSYNDKNQLIYITGDNYSETYIRSKEGTLLLIIIVEDGKTNYLLPTFDDFSTINDNSYFIYDKITDNLTISTNWKIGDKDIKPYKITKLDDSIIIKQDDTGVENTYNSLGQLIKVITPSSTTIYTYKNNVVIETKKISDKEILIINDKSETKYDIDNNILEKNLVMDDVTIKTIYRQNKEYAIITYDSKTGKTIEVEYI